METVKNINPFKSYRAELTQEEFFDYFVPPYFLQTLIGSNPVMIIGERGTGKTTLLKYLSYHNQKKVCDLNFPNGCDYIGIYWRVDINYITAFYGKNLDENKWIDLFGHYMALIFCIELCKIILDMKKNNVIQFNLEKHICSMVVEDFYSDDIIDSFEELYIFLRKKLHEIERYINNMGRFEPPVLSMLERPFTNFCNELSKEKQLEGKAFYFLIDEYENLLEYQQKILNTFIKHSTLPYTYKVCLRHKGQRTPETLNVTEYLSDPADYIKFDLTAELKLKNPEKYVEFAKNVCKKRLQMVPELKEKNLDDISYFLKGLSVEEEAQRLVRLSKSKQDPYKELFKEIINNDDSTSSKQKVELLSTFLSISDPILKRLCLSILQRRKLKVIELLNEYNNHIEGKPSKFTSFDGKDTDWIHNYKNGILFLLCSDYGRKKLYCGFDTFIELSSGVIRYFIELCNVTFMFAFNEGYSFQNSQPIEIEIQDKAAKYVSEKRFHEIDTYPPYGNSIKNLVFCMGKVFSFYHKDPKQSEPEKNQFTIDDIPDLCNKDYIEKISEAIEYAVMWGVIRELKSTKNKSKYKIMDTDYCLHPIYSPFFEISFRKGRKLDVSYKDIGDMLFNGVSANERIMKRLFKGKGNRNTTFLQESIFSGKYLEDNNTNE